MPQRAGEVLSYEYPNGAPTYCRGTALAEDYLVVRGQFRFLNISALTSIKF
jgi:hypothetical protein